MTPEKAKQLKEIADKTNNPALKKEVEKRLTETDKPVQK
jgi:hypothetical protein